MALASYKGCCICLTSLRIYRNECWYVMKVIRELDQLLECLGLDQRIIHPDFHIFKLDDFDVAYANDLVPHYRDFFEITLAIEDAGKFYIGESKYSSLDQSIGFISPEQLFSYSRDGGDAKGFCMLFRPSFFRPAKQNFEILNEFSFFKMHTISLYKLQALEMELFRGLFGAIYDEYYTNDGSSIEIIRAYLNIIMQRVKRMANDELEKVSFSRPMQIASEFEDLLYKYSDRNATVSEYAEMLSVSKTYLSECVKRVSGKSAKQLILNYKIIRAKSLLSQTDMSIKEIAYKLDFSDSTNFSKFFKRHVFVSPKEFRNRLLF